jgi:hypothetical protein
VIRGLLFDGIDKLEQDLVNKEHCREFLVLVLRHGRRMNESKRGYFGTAFRVNEEHKEL